MERLHWVRHRGYSPPRKASNQRRRRVCGRHGAQREETEARGYPGNAIRTTKYSLITFIPKNLFQQFHRVANLYFLFLALLNWVPVVEAFEKEITMVPLLLVLSAIAIKDALEDYRRYLFDRKVNNRHAHVYWGKVNNCHAHVYWGKVNNRHAHVYWG